MPRLLGRSRPPGLRGPGSGRPGLALAAHFLVILVALAGHQHHVARPGAGHRPLHRRPAVQLHGHRGRVGGAVQHGVDDRLRILAPGVVAGQDQPVGAGFRGGRHQRAFAAVPVAAATDHAMQAAGEMLAHRRQGLLQPVRGVRVINDHRGLARLAHRLHAARHRRDGVERRAQPFRCHAQAVQDPGHRHQVAAVEGAEQRHRHIDRFATHGEAQIHARLVGLLGHAAHRGAGLAAEDDAAHAVVEATEEHRRREVVAVDHRLAQVRTGEQGHLGQQVAVHVAVVIQMVAAQIAEHRRPHRGIAQTVLVQGVGRDLHGHGVGASVTQVAQAALQGDRVRRGVAGGDLGALETQPQGTHQPAVVTQGVQGVTQEPGDAGLAVGAGHADHFQLPAGLAMETGRQLAHPTPQFRHRDARHRGLVADREDIALFQHHGGAGADRRVDETAAVHLMARHRQEQIAALHGAAVEAQGRHGQIPQGRRQGLVGQQVAQGDHERPSPSKSPAIRPSVLSGGTCRVRSTPPTMEENTGAATRPP
ncbi:hypothetical protein ASALC70_01153 [Alcanivorax sp. ALC70]|nr:hypothetical protein ASALC70_01153 [Alcanivorax sp. ALC70]